MSPSKKMRLEEIFRRLSEAQPVSSVGEAHRMISAIMTQVEDEMTDSPNDPSRWMELDRMFPPDWQYAKSVGNGDVMRFGHLKEITYIGVNGAIAVRQRTKIGDPIVERFAKSGADGRTVVDVCPELRDRNL